MAGDAHAHIMVAGAGRGQWGLVVWLTDRGMVLGQVGLVCLALGLLFWPEGKRPRRRFGRGTAAFLIVAWCWGTLPLPVLVVPAYAGGGGGGGSPTPTPQRGESLGLLYYHFDHLGSTQVLTRGNDGSVFRLLRYDAYGRMRGNYQPGSGATGRVYPEGCAGYGYCREFTGYQSEPISGLAYAGARFYQPALGMFLTHDPARHFASPYAYTGWNPLNLTDPSGAFVAELVAGILTVANFVASYAVPIGMAVGFATAFGQTLANGGSFNDALGAGVIGGISGGVAALGMGVVAGVVVSLGNPLVQYAVALAALGAGAYQSAQAFESGQYVVGAVGAVFVAFGLAALGARAYAKPQAGPGQGRRGGLSLAGKQLASNQEGVVLNDASGGEGSLSDFFECGRKTATATSRWGRPSGSGRMGKGRRSRWMRTSSIFRDCVQATFERE